MHPFSESMGSVVRVQEIALSLGKSGVEVYIFTPYERSFDLFPHVHVVSASSLINTLGLSKTIYKFSKLLYYNQAFPTLFSKIELQYSKVMAKMVKGLAKLIIKEGISLIQVEQDVALPIGISLKEETGLPLIVDVHNVSSEELVAAGVLEKKSPKFFALQNFTKRQFSETDHVVVVSEYMRNYIIGNYGINSFDVSVVPSGGRVIVDNSIVETRRKPMKVVYAGLVAYREHVDLFVKSMPFVLQQDSAAKFYITNKGEALRKVKRLANILGFNPEFFWYDNYRDVNRFLSSCHLGVLPSSDDIARRMGTPVKLFNYMSVGLPVVANNIGGWTNIIEDEKVGLLADTGTPEDFALAINKLLRDETLRRELSYNALNAIKEKYSWDHSVRPLVKAYERFC